MPRFATLKFAERLHIYEKGKPKNNPERAEDLHFDEYTVSVVRRNVRESYSKLFNQDQSRNDLYLASSNGAIELTWAGYPLPLSEHDPALILHSSTKEGLLPVLEEVIPQDLLEKKDDKKELERWKKVQFPDKK